MKRTFVVALLLFSLLVAMWGCDMSALPTPTLVAPTVTSTLVAPTSPTSQPPTPVPALPTQTEAPTLDPTPTDAVTPTVEPTLLASPTPAPASTSAARSSATARIVEEPATVAPEEITPGTVPATRIPRPTRIPAGPTPTLANEPPTPSTSEVAPTGGWSEVVRVAPGKHRIALTFDAGASGEALPKILNALRERNLHITMFFTGKFAEQYPEGLKQAIADGHEIANHTYSHLDSRDLTDEQLANELARTEGIITGLTGVSTKPYWRPPYGARNNHVLNVAVSQGYRSIYWTLDSLDSVGQPKTPDFIFNRVTNTPGVNLDGAIILQHFGSDVSATALPRILDRLQEMGLQVVTISQLLSP